MEVDLSLLKKGNDVEAVGKNGGWVQCKVRKVHLKLQKVDVGVGRSWWRVGGDGIRSSAPPSPPQRQPVEKEPGLEGFDVTGEPERPGRELTQLKKCSSYVDLLSELLLVYALHPTQLVPFGKLKKSLALRGVSLTMGDISTLAAATPPAVSHHWNTLTQKEQGIHSRGAALCEGSITDTVDGFVLMVKMNKHAKSDAKKMMKSLEKMKGETPMEPPPKKNIATARKIEENTVLGRIKSQSDALLKECSVMIKKTEVKNLSRDLEEQLNRVKKYQNDLKTEETFSGMKLSGKAQSERVRRAKDDAVALKTKLADKKNELETLGVDVKSLLNDGNKKRKRDGNVEAMRVAAGLRDVKESELLQQLEAEQLKEGLRSLYGMLIQWSLMRLRRSEPESVTALTLHLATPVCTSTLSSTLDSLSTATVDAPTHTPTALTLHIRPSSPSASLLSQAWHILSTSHAMRELLRKHDIMLVEKSGGVGLLKGPTLGPSVVKEVAVAAGNVLEGKVMAAIDAEGVRDDPKAVLMKVKVPADPYLLMMAVKEVKTVLTDAASKFYKKYQPKIVSCQTVKVPTNTLTAKRSWCFRSNIESLVTDLTGLSTLDPTQRKAGAAQLRKSYKDRLKFLSEKLPLVIGLDHEGDVVRMQLSMSQEEYNTALSEALSR